MDVVEHQVMSVMRIVLLRDLFHHTYISEFTAPMRRFGAPFN